MLELVKISHDVYKQMSSKPKTLAIAPREDTVEQLD